MTSYTDVIYALIREIESWTSDLARLRDSDPDAFDELVMRLRTILIDELEQESDEIDEPNRLMDELREFDKREGDDD